jgi:peptidyl-prolyl cis-trans isomerase D
MIRFLQTPGRFKKYVLGGILLIFCLTLVITLVPTGAGDSTLTKSGVLAKVGGEEITIQSLQTWVRQQTGRDMNMSGPIVDQALQAEIRQKAMLQEADRLGLRVTDAELVDYLHKGQAGQMFFPKGEFIGQDKYNEFWQERNTTAAEVESQMKQKLLMDKLQDTVTAGAQVPTEDVQREFTKQNTQVKLAYAVVKGDEIAKTINPKESELKAYYDLHKAQYATPLPEKRKVRYIVIDFAKLQDQIKPTQQEVEDYYNKNLEQFRVPEEIKVSQIVIKVPPKADAKTDEAAKAKAEDILKQLRAGANFADLAKRYSEDEGTAQNGGSMGQFIRRSSAQGMGTEFEQAFSIPTGQVSGVIKTEFGYKIMKVDDRHEARLKPLEEVKPLIQTQVASRNAQDQANKLADEVSKQAASEGLDAAAAKNHLAVTESAWFGRDGSLPSIGTSSEFTDAVFRTKEKSPPSQVGISTGYVIYQLAGVKPPVPPTYDDVRDKVVVDFKQEQTNSMAFKKAQELSDRAHKLNDLPRAAKELGIAVETTSGFEGPTGEARDLGSLRGGASVAFSMKPGEISSPIRTEGKNMAVLSVVDRKEPTAADFAKSGDQIRETLLEQKRNEMLQLYTEGLKQTLEKEGKIKINQQQVDAYAKQTPETNYNQ